MHNLSQLLPIECQVSNVSLSLRLNTPACTILTSYSKSELQTELDELRQQVNQNNYAASTSSQHQTHESPTSLHGSSPSLTSAMQLAPLSNVSSTARAQPPQPNLNVLPTPRSTGNASTGNQNSPNPEQTRARVLDSVTVSAAAIEDCFARYVTLSDN